MRRLDSSRYNRRQFLHTAAAASAVVAAPGIVSGRNLNEKVNLAAVGCGGKGWGDINSCAAGHNVIAVCDVEQGKPVRGKGGYLAAREKWPQASGYADWRKMLDKEHDSLDGITVSTPDHMHAPVTMAAIQLGLATYTQKPLTRTVHEARQLTSAAQQAGVVTQMGNQGHSGIPYRTLVELIRSGTIGRVLEAHTWSNRPIWPQGVDRAQGSNPIPETLHWDLWLGVAEERPYVSRAYHPFNWRGWFDFGAGALGDMGCHIIDPVVWSLELGPPLSVTYDGPAPREETFPKEETLRYVFAGTKHTKGETIEVTWYDGGRLPDAKLAPLPAGEKLPTNGCLLVGEEGVLLCRHGGQPQLLPEEKFRDLEVPKLEPHDHYQQWTNAIRGQDETTSSFAYAGPLTETVLLGVIACRFPEQRLEWDAERLEFPNSEDATALVKQPYRKGWEVSGLS